MGNSLTLFHALFEGQRSNAKTCAIEPFQHETFFVIISLILSLFLSLSLSLFSSFSFVLYLSFVPISSFSRSLYLSFFSCSEVEQSCHVSFLLCISVMSRILYILCVYCHFLVETRATMETCTVKLFEHEALDQKKPCAWTRYRRWTPLNSGNAWNSVIVNTASDMILHDT